MTGAEPRRERWIDLRNRLGTAHDRLGALRLISAATGYIPLPHQLRFHLAGAGPGVVSQKLALGGIGSGKTRASMVEVAILALLTPNCVGAVISPTYDLAVSVLWPEFSAILDGLAKAGWPLSRRFLRSMMEVELIGGGKILFRSAKSLENLRGFTLAYAAIDESETHMNPRYLYDVIVGRLRDPRANVLQIHVTTTPQGMRGVPEIFVQRRHAAKALPPMERDRDLRRYYCIRATSHDNHHLPEGYLDGLKVYSKRAYKQEVLGKVLQPSSAVWPEWDRDRHVMPYTYDPTRPYTVSIDWGRTCHAIWIQRHHAGPLVIFDEYTGEEGGTPRDRLRAVIVQRCQALRRDPEYAVGDRAVKDEMSWLINQFPKTWVRRMVSRFEPSVSAGVEVVRSLLDPIEGAPMLYVAQVLADSTDPRGIARCLAGYRYKMRADGTVDPDNFYKDNRLDHGADAARMAARVLVAGDARGFNVARTYGAHADRSGDIRQGRPGHR